MILDAYESENEHHHPGSPNGVGAVQFASTAGFPIKAKEKVIGVLHLANKVKRYLASDELQLIASIAQEIGVAADNAQLFEQVTSKTQELSKINKELDGAGAERRPDGAGRGGRRAHDDAGRIVVDAHQRTTAEGVWALGDVSTPVPLKHVANREADVVRHNLRHPDDLMSAGHDLVPSAIFTHPQIAAVGATRTGPARPGCRLPRRPGPLRRRRLRVGDGGRDGVLQGARRPGRRHDPGRAHHGPPAPALVQPLVLAATLGITARTLVDRPYWIHPALTEVVQQALLETVS